MAALEFARAVLARLDVMSPAAFESWYQLNYTHDPGHFFTLMAELPPQVRWSKSPRTQPMCRSAERRSTARASDWIELAKLP